MKIGTFKPPIAILANRFQSQKNDPFFRISLIAYVYNTSIQVPLPGNQGLSLIINLFSVYDFKLALTLWDAVLDYALQPYITDVTANQLKII